MCNDMRLNFTSGSSEFSRVFSCGSKKLLRHKRRHFSAQGPHVAFAVGVDGVGQQDDEALVFRIDPEAGAGETGVPEGDAALEPLAARLRIAGVGIEARIGKGDKYIYH